MTDQDYLDGNAAAGLLSEVFAADITTAVGHCANCGDTAVVARGRVYVDEHGLILRCSTCGDILAVASERAGRLCLDLRGLASLEFPVA